MQPFDCILPHSQEFGVAVANRSRGAGRGSGQRGAASQRATRQMEQGATGLATFEDACGIGRKLPGTGDGDGLSIAVKGKPKGFAWPWAERVHPKRPRVPNFGVLAVRTASCDEKDALIAADPDKFFTEPHYNGFPAVLVRLSAIGPEELEELLIDAWRTLASRELRAQLDTRSDGE